MSDVNGAEAQDAPYISAVDAAFSAAWNSEFNPEDPATADQSTGETDSAAGGNEAPASTDEGAGAEAGAGAAPAGGAGSEPGGAAAPSVDEQSASGGNDAASGTASQQPTLVSSSTLAPKFAEASLKIEERINNSFRAQAISELNADIGTKYDQAIRTHPRLLVGTKVPSLKGEGEELIRDSADAREWQEAAKALMDEEVEARIEAKMSDVKPMLGVIQESVNLFQSNPDLVPKTKEFDQELADEFAATAKEYELRINGKLYGYQVNVQPLINRIRARLSAERGASGAVNQQRQQQAADQARKENGQFDGPQAGIISKAGQSGGGEDNYDDFWRSVGMKV